MKIRFEKFEKFSLKRIVLLNGVPHDVSFLHKLDRNKTEQHFILSSSVENSAQNRVTEN